MCTKHMDGNMNPWQVESPASPGDVATAPSECAGHGEIHAAASFAFSHLGQLERYAC